MRIVNMGWRTFLLGIFLMGNVVGQDSYRNLLELHQEFLRLRRPPSANGIQDHRPATIQRRQEELGRLMARLERLPIQEWTIPQQTDYLLVRAQMNDLSFGFRVGRSWARDPGFYLDQFARIPYTQLPLGTTEIQRLRTRLKSVAPIVAQAKENLTDAVADMARLTIGHLSRYDGVGQGIPRLDPPIEGTVGWFQDLVDRLAKNHPQAVPEARQALSASKDYLAWLQQHVGSMNPVGGVGLEPYQWFLTNVRLMPFTIRDLRVLADRELHRIQTFLAIEQNQNRGLPELRVPPTESEFNRALQEAETQIREHIEKYNLLTIPQDTPDRFESDVFWIIRPGNSWHFWEQLQYRNPLNNHIHASIPGHRFDGFIQRKLTHPIRQTHRDGARSEGWGFYIEEMLMQSGLLDDKPRVKELFYIAALKRAVRIPAELGLQSGEMAFQEALDYMIDRVPFLDQNLARYDMEVYIRRPTYGMNYTMGRIQLEQLLGERILQLGDKFVLGEFHDSILNAGCIPFSLIRWEMTGQDAEIRQFLPENAIAETRRR